MVSVTSPRTLRAFPMTGVISALPANHRLEGSLENLILKISSRVDARRCLWGKLLSSMIRYRLNVTNNTLYPVSNYWTLLSSGSGMLQSYMHSLSSRLFDITLHFDIVITPQN